MAMVSAGVTLRVRAWIGALCGVAGCASPVCGAGQSALNPSFGDGEFLYQDDVVLEFGIELGDPDALPTEPDPDADDVPATLSFDGQAYEVGLSLKGTTSWEPISRKPAFKIDMHEYDREQTLFGVRRLTFNNMVQDVSQLSEHLAVRLFAAAGVPSPRQGYACLSINGERLGLYSVVETPDEQLLERILGETGGALLEGDQVADLMDRHVFRFDVEEGDEAVLDLLRAFVEELDATAPEAYLELLDRWTDREALLAYWAADILIGNYDGYASYIHNYFVIWSESEQRLTMMPWGVDRAFSRTLDPHVPDELTERGRMGRLFRDCVASAPCRAAYDKKRAEIQELVVEMDLAGLADDARERLRSSPEIDLRNEVGALETRAVRRRVVRYVRDIPEQE